MDFNNRKNLLSLIALDVIVLLFSVAIIFSRYNTLAGISAENNHKLQTKNLSSKIKEENLTEPTAQLGAQEKQAAQPQPVLSAEQQPQAQENALQEKRNIKFTYRNSKAKKVDIVGDFNGWVPQSLDKDDNSSWSITASITPGEYGYNFVVNGKPVKDPNNPNTVNTGRGFTSSFLKVKPR